MFSNEKSIGVAKERICSVLPAAICADKLLGEMSDGVLCFCQLDCVVRRPGFEWLDLARHIIGWWHQEQSVHISLHVLRP